MPTELPMMAASASGLSMTRLLPKRRCRSSVTRNTPPSTPTSSPMTSTSGSRSISWRRARFSALTMLRLGMTLPRGRPLAAHGRRRRTRLLARGGAVAQAPRQRVALGTQMRRHLGVRMVEHDQRVGGRHRLEAGDGRGDLGVDALREPLLEQVALLEIGAESGEWILALPLR